MVENNIFKVVVYDLGIGKEDYFFYLFFLGKIIMKSYMVIGDFLLLKDKMFILIS